MGRLIIELGQELVEHSLIILFIGVFQQEIFPADQFAVTNEENLHTSIAILPRQRHHILVRVGSGDDLLPGHHFSRWPRAGRG